MTLYYERIVMWRYAFSPHKECEQAPEAHAWRAAGSAMCLPPKRSWSRPTASTSMPWACASGSALTHAGMLGGLRALGEQVPVLGICVRRDAASQGARMARVAGALAAMIECPDAFDAGDVDVSDAVPAPGYGRLDEAVRKLDGDAGMGRLERGEPLPAGTKLWCRPAASKKRRQSRGGRGITDRGAGNRGVGCG